MRLQFIEERASRDSVGAGHTVNEFREGNCSDSDFDLAERVSHGDLRTFHGLPFPLRRNDCA